MYSRVRQGLVTVNTGNAKGKSTSAFCIVLRSWGRGFRVCVVQFIKAETGKWGEIKAAKKLGIDWLAKGDGITIGLMVKLFHRDLVHSNLPG